MNLRRPIRPPITGPALMRISAPRLVCRSALNRRTMRTDLARELDHARGVVGPLQREARSREIRGADRPHLLDPVLLGGLVEPADDVAQQAHRAVLAQLARQRVETDEIDVRDGHVGERLWRIGGAAPDLRGGRRRQQALQQALVLLHLAVEILAAVAKVPHHLVECLTELAVLVVRRDVDLHVQGPLC